MPVEPDVLSKSEHDRIFQEEIIPQYFKGRKPQAKPEVVFLAGQPGAGKSGLRDAAMKTNFDGADKLPVMSDPDDLRGFHPRYLQHAKDDPLTAAEKVHPDASKWNKELIAYAIANRYNVIVDGTLGSPESTPRKLEQFKEAGYGVEVHAIAVPRDVSQQGVRARFEKVMYGKKMWEETKDPKWASYADAVPRYVPEHIQDEAYDGMQQSIALLEDPKNAKLLDRVVVRDRGQNLLADTAREDLPPPSAALKAKRDAPLSTHEAEDHYQSIRETVDWMRSRGAPEQLVDPVVELYGKAFQAWLKKMDTLVPSRVSSEAPPPGS